MGETFSIPESSVTKSSILTTVGAKIGRSISFFKASFKNFTALLLGTISLSVSIFLPDRISCFTTSVKKVSFILFPFSMHDYALSL